MLRFLAGAKSFRLNVFKGGLIKFIFYLSSIYGCMLCGTVEFYIDLLNVMILGRAEHSRSTISGSSK